MTTTANSKVSIIKARANTSSPRSNNRMGTNIRDLPSKVATMTKASLNSR